MNTLRDYYGPTMNAVAAARASGREEQLQAELNELFERLNTSTSADETTIDATFLRVTATV